MAVNDSRSKWRFAFIRVHSWLKFYILNPISSSILDPRSSILVYNRYAYALEHRLPVTDPARVRRIVTQAVLLVAAAAALIWLLFALRMVLFLLAFTAIFCYLIAPGWWISLNSRSGSAIRPASPAHAGDRHRLSVDSRLTPFTLEKVGPMLSDQLGAFFENTPNYAKQLDQYAIALGGCRTAIACPPSGGNPDRRGERRDLRSAELAAGGGV